MKSKPEPHQYNGFYIEAGAGDGEIISNSLYFEINYKVIYNNNNLTDEINEKCVFINGVCNYTFFSGQDY